MPFLPPDANSHRDICETLLREVRRQDDHPISRVATGSHLCMLTSHRTGMASFLPRQEYEDPASFLPHEGTSALDLVRTLPESTGSQQAVYALAAVNSLLPAPDTMVDLKGQDLILAKGAGQRVVVVGHFPFVDRLKARFASFHVIERHPHEGDVLEQDAGSILAAAQLAAITSTTLANGSLGGILNQLAPDCFVMLLGPSTPLCEPLFDHGIHALAGALVDDDELLGQGVARGLPFRRLAGVRHVLLTRP